MSKRNSSLNFSGSEMAGMREIEDGRNNRRNSRASQIVTGSGIAQLRLTEERNALIHVRQNELDQVIDEHDTMVSLNKS